ncbi:hypothetical protein BG621_02975 [Parasaccharibacter apium]|nr:hypothetical protein BG621_02975 [Parasaccharibacter apium]
MIVPSAAIEWNEVVTQTRGVETATRHSGRFAIEGAGEASLEVYEYSKGVFSYRNVNLPDGCECVSMFNIEA